MAVETLVCVQVTSWRTQFGETEGEDDEIDAGDAQRRRAHQTRHDGADGGGDHEQQRIGQHLDAEADGIGAEAVEGGGGERDIVGRPRKQRPGGAERGVEDDVDRDRQVEALVEERQKRRQRDQSRAEAEVPRLLRGEAHHVGALPKMPWGRKRSTRMNRP
jgi:hypothetical protein